MKRFFKFFFPFLTFLTMLFILNNSASTAEQVGKTTGDIAEVIEEQVGSVTHQNVTFSGEQKVMISKIGHFLEYAFFALFLSLSVTALGQSLGEMFFHVLFCTVFLALADEQLQFLFLDRGSRVSDVIIDLAGGFFGYGIARLSFRIWERRKEK